MTTIDATPCEKQGSHVHHGDHSVQQCPIYGDAVGVCTNCGGTEFGHIGACGVLAAEVGKKKVSDDLLSYARQAYERTVHQTAESLREIANDFERTALDTATFTHAPRVRASARALHTLNWGLANASIERVVRQASETDEIEERARS